MKNIGMQQLKNSVKNCLLNLPCNKSPLKFKFRLSKDGVGDRRSYMQYSIVHILYSNYLYVIDLNLIFKIFNDIFAFCFNFNFHLPFCF